MADKLKNMTLQEARLQRLSVLREMDSLLKAIEADSGGTATAGAAEPDDAKDEALARLPLQYAVVEYLKGCNQPQTPKQIAEALKQAGREFESSKPTLAIRDALRKALPNNKDLVHSGYAKWFLKTHSKTKAQRLLSEGKRSKGTGGRSAAEHGARTRAGMERRRAAGLRIGQPLRLTAEQYLKYLGLRAEGVAKGPAARAIGMSVSSIYNYEGRFALDAWKPGDPWPPPEKGANPSPPAPGGPEPTLRLVK